MNAPVAEIVTFRLIDGANANEFASAANALTPFLAQTKAAGARVLSVGEDGVWTDHIQWSSLAAAKDAAARLMSLPEAAPMLAMIDPDTVTMRHAPILLATEH